MSATESPEKAMSAMFAQLVMQNTNMALIFLGQMPNPQTGQTAQELDHARYFIDQLEMLEAKTKGNLDTMEAGLLKQSLTSLRMAFVEAVNHPAPSPAPVGNAPAATPATETGNAPATDEQETPINEPALPGEAPPPSSDSAPNPKRFTKKY